MKIPIYTGVLGIAIALCPGALSAVEDIPPLGWNEVARLALEQSPDIRSARIDLAGADAQRLTARQLPNPSLSVSVSKIPTDGTAASTSYGNGFFDRGYDTVVQVAEVLELGGKRARRVRSAAAGHEAATERLADAQRLAVAVARKALIQAVLARETATVARATAASLAKSAAIARAREGSGDLSRADREQVEIAAATFEANAGTAESAARAAALALDAALSLPTPSGRTLPDSLRALSDEAGPGFDSSQSAEELAESDARRVDLRPDLLALGASAKGGVGVGGSAGPSHPRCDPLAPVRKGTAEPEEHGWLRRFDSAARSFAQCGRYGRRTGGTGRGPPGA